MTDLTVLERLSNVELGADQLLAKHTGADRLQDFSPYHDDPVGFAKEILHFRPWDKQIEVMESVARNKRTVVPGAHAMGKDAVLAALLLWSVYARDMLAIALSATERQLLGQLWAETARHFDRAKRLPGELYIGNLRVGGERRIQAMTSGSTSNLTGWHNYRGTGVFVAISESQAEQVEGVAFEAAAGNAAGSGSRICVVGNPIRSSGKFMEVTRLSTWNTIHISAFDHPNVATGRVVIPGGPSPGYPEEIAEEYGKGSPFYVSRVLGQFPDQDEESLLPRSHLDAAADRHESGAFQSETEVEPIISVDPARFGPDATVLAVRRGPVLERLVEWRRLDTMQTVTRVEREMLKEGVRPRPQMEWQRPAFGRVIVDTVGLGAGVFDRLKELRYRTHSYNGGTFGSGQRKFFNLRAESYWRLRELLEKGRIALPRDGALFQELLALKWKPTSDGRIQMEKKDDLKGRIGRSPDRADAVAMAFALDVMRTQAKFFEWRV